MQSIKASIDDVKSDVRALRDDFGSMEKGRLTSLEVKHAKLVERIKAYTAIGGVLLAVFQTIITAVIINWLVK